MRFTRYAAAAVFTIATSIASVSAYADCGDLSQDNPITDALVSSLRQQASMAEANAAMALNPAVRQRWQATAQSLNAQADAAERRAQAIGRVAEQACKVLTPSDGDDDDN